MRLFSLTVMLAAVFAPDRPNPTEPPKPPIMDFELPQGTWVVVEYQTENGPMDPASVANHPKLIIKGNNYSWANSGGGTFKIDPKLAPKHVDYTVGNLQAQAYLGIYELNGDTFRDCMATPGRPRPTDFTTPPGSGRIMMVYRRVR
jgi:uncharacterized protein (TIGR03067 family)